MHDYRSHTTNLSPVQFDDYDRHAESIAASCRLDKYYFGSVLNDQNLPWSNHTFEKDHIASDYHGILLFAYACGRRIFVGLLNFVADCL
jgi:hypothetical protein